MSFETEIARVKPGKDTLFTIGVFDGIHLGHQYLFSTLRERAKASGRLSGVLTFTTHPEAVINPSFKLDWLHTPPDRVSLIRAQGIDIVIGAAFDRKLMQLEPHGFMVLMQKHLRVKGLLVGPDFALGKGRSGNIEVLKELGEETGFSVEVIPPFLINGEHVSSSIIRKAVAEGDMRKAARLLGRPFSIHGSVIPGDKRGRELGFPTLNQEIKKDMAAPPHGVYTTRIHTDRQVLPAVTFIGTRPTFSGVGVLVETHVYDNNGPFKDKSAEVDFMQRIRGEEKFPDAEALKEAIRRDIRKAKEILKEEKR